MNKRIKVVSLLMLVGCLISCSNNQNKPDSGEGQQSYENRVQTTDFTILDLTSGITSPNDPRYFDDSKTIDYYRKKEQIRMYYLDRIDDVYYLNLDTFAKVFKDDLSEGIASNVIEEHGIATWTLTKGDKQVYKLAVDGNKKTISVDSEMEEELVKPIYVGKTGVNDYAQVTIDYVPGHENKTRVFNFAKYNFDIFKVDDTYCYPFALLAAETSKIMDRSFLFLSAYKELVKYGIKSQLTDTSFNMDGKEVAADTYIRGAFNQLYKSPEDETVNVAPKTLSVFNKKLFYFIMDNYYGLAKEKGIKSMTDYFENFEGTNSFEAVNGIERGTAYNRAVQMLNDLHTSYEYSSYFSESSGTQGAGFYSQTLYKDRMALQLYLSSLRSAAIDKYNKSRGLSVDDEVTFKNVRYSEDNKYAYFSFDAFETFNYYGDGAVPENKLLEDSFYLFVKNLNEIKAKGVKKIIIDDSCNGGGYVTIMGKLLALLSKDNKSEMFLRDDATDAIQKITTRVDSNRDGVYDANDCFGADDITFYIVTSKFSFSCGNAFPFYAQINGLAKIIGQSSGGGECCVFGFNFPSGQGLGYSSPYHLGYYNTTNNRYYGDEAGATPTYSVDSSWYELFDVDVLGQRIDLAENH